MKRNQQDRIATGTQASKTVRWVVGIGVTILLTIGLGLLVLLTQATSNRALYDRNYDRLYMVNTIVAVLLLLGLVWGLTRLIIRLRQGQFGSRLLVKLAAIFALVGLVPGVLIYVVSYQFVSRSIESWFDVKVEGALVAGLNLGRATLDTLSGDLAKQSRVAAQQLVDVQEASAAINLDRVRTQMDANEAVLWSLDGRLIASASQSRFAIQPERPTAAQFKQVRSKLSVEIVEGLDETVGAPTGRIKVLTLVPQNSLNLREDPWVLQISQELPATLVANALDVQLANREYQERALARDGLRKMYIGTLTLSLIMAVLAAVLLAVLLGNQLARPLLLLAHGMRQVAAGDLSPKYTLQANDELGGLTRSFAEMTQQLSDARSAVERSLTQLGAARENLANYSGQPDRWRDCVECARRHSVFQPGCHPYFESAFGRPRQGLVFELAQFATFCLGCSGAV